MDKDGVPYRAILESRLKRARKEERRQQIEAELNPPLPPACVRHIFTIYMRLRRRKASTGFGPAAIEWPDLDAFLRLTGTQLSAWEIEVLEDLDNLFLFEKSKPPAPGQKQPNAPDKEK